MPVTLPPLADWSRLAEEPDRLVPLPTPPGEPPLFMRFRRIPPGWFWMGSRGLYHDEEPPHRVVVPHEFWLGKFVVTQEEWSSVVRAPSGLKELNADPSEFKGPRRPVETVSWEDATTWCTALTESFVGPLAGWTARLPWEVEWEYACRAGTETDYWNGDGVEALAQVGWYDDNSGQQTHPVDEVPMADSREHPAGLVGMHGNIWEWCQDAGDDLAYAKRSDPWRGQEWTAAESGQETAQRVLRGGSWGDSARRCQSAVRGRNRADDRYLLIGFRVCLVPGPSAQEARGA
ncbi:MAG: formylglycine-generating enzyme family protein [Verrucomicrobiota bacterium]